MNSVAIMQPYFIPYAGYFRLFTMPDLFVIYDCVQFPRRGWVHRNKLTTYNKDVDWITIPLKKQQRDVKINNLEFADEIKDLWQKEKNKFPIFKVQSNIIENISNLSSEKPLNFIVNSLKEVCDTLEIKFNVIFSSELKIPEEYKGQNRIIEICKRLKAKTYINSPGGVELYNKEIFNKNGINLAFLTKYQGSNISILERVAYENTIDIKQEILSHCTFI